MEDRIIVLLDMDCFYVQVEERDNPHIKGKPAAVVQYNTWKGGGIIAVNYEARAFGVKRGMRGQDAKELCPSIHLIQVPVSRDKADLTKYRNAGKEVVDILCQFGDCVERASIDEAYIDFSKVVIEKLNSEGVSITKEDLPSTWIVGHDLSTDDEQLSPQSIRQSGLSTWFDDYVLSFSRENESTDESKHKSSKEEIKLAYAASVCENMRDKILEVTGFKCSAGISVNKMLAKLACGLHKPNQQTILPMKSVPYLWSSLPIRKVRNLGGKLGESLVEDFSCQTMADLSALSLKQLRNHYDEKTALWLYNVGQGIDHEPVTARQLAKSIGCGKNFTGKEALDTRAKVESWIMKLSEELAERLAHDQNSNERTAKTLSVSVRFDESGCATRSCPLVSYKTEKIAKRTICLISGISSFTEKDTKWTPSIKNISLSAGKFDHFSLRNVTKIDSMFEKIKKSRGVPISPKIETPSNQNGEEEYEGNLPWLEEAPSTSTKSFFTNDSNKAAADMRTKENDCSNSENDSLIANAESQTDLTCVYEDSTDVDEVEIVDRSSVVFNFSSDLPSNRSFNERVATSSSTIDVNRRTPAEKRKMTRKRRHKRMKNSSSPTVRKVNENDHNKSAGSPKSFFLKLLSHRKRQPECDLHENSTREESPSALNDQTIHPNDDLINTKDRIDDNKHLTHFEANTVTKRTSSISCTVFHDSNEREGTANSSPHLDLPSTSFHAPSDDSVCPVVSAKELFPDLSDVDPSVLALFPEDVRQRIEHEIKLLNKESTPNRTMIHCNTSVDIPGNSTNASVIHTEKNKSGPQISQRNVEFCNECNRKIPSGKILEHRDYHFAVELRKQQLFEQRTALVSEAADIRKTVTTRNGRANKRKSLTSNTPTIDSFFKFK